MIGRRSALQRLGQSWRILALPLVAAFLGFVAADLFGKELPRFLLRWIALPSMFLAAIVICIAELKPNRLVLPIIGTIDPEKDAARFFGPWALSVFPFGFGAGIFWEPGQ